MNNYLVTGGLGFIGSHLTQELLKDPENRVWIIDDGTNAAWNPRRGRIDYDEHVRDLLVQLMGGYEVDNDSRNPSLVCISGDCAHANVLDRIRAGHFRAVFHLAADASVTKSIEEPMTTLERNVVKSLQIAKACAEGSTRLVFSSSAAVYGQSPVETRYPTFEHHQKAPTNPYGLSKLTCENWFATYQDLYGLDYVALRYFNVYGGRQQGGSPYAGVIGNWVHALHYNKHLVIYGDGEQTRDFIHVSDVARANVKAAQSTDLQDMRAFNISSGGCISLNELVTEFSKSLGKKVPLKYEEARKNEVKWSVGSHAAALVTLEWEPAISLGEGLTRTFIWRGLL